MKNRPGWTKREWWKATFMLVLVCCGLAAAAGWLAHCIYTEITYHHESRTGNRNHQ